MTKSSEENTPPGEKKEGALGVSSPESKSSLQQLLEKTPPPPLPSRRASPAKLEVAPRGASAPPPSPSSGAFTAVGASGGPSSPQVIPDGLILDNRYRLLQLLGEGGMGAVYKAEHILMRKPVAIKILKREAAGEPDLVMRFTREAQLSSRISNPHCVTVHDFGQTPDRSLYLVMELIEGESLRERLNRGGRLPLLEAYALFSQLLEALSAAHKIGVVHRDLKPENIMLVSDEKGGEGKSDFLKLLDFGIARPSGQAAQGLTRAGFTVGTPGYIAPEQALGQAVDLRADLYSAGVIFYEMLLGRRPYQGRSPMEVLTTQVSTPPPPPSQVAPEVKLPAGVEEILLKVLAREPQDRFPDAATLKAALEKAIFGASLPPAAAKEASLPAASAPEAPQMPVEPEEASLPEPVQAPLPPPAAATPLPMAMALRDEEELSSGGGGGRRWAYLALAFLCGAAFSALGGYFFWAGEEAPPAAPRVVGKASSPARELLAAGKTSEAWALLRALPAEERHTPESQGLLALAAAREQDWAAARAATRAARALGGFPEDIRPFLLEEISRASKTKEAALARRVACELGPEAVEDLMKMLRSSNEGLKRTAAATLAELYDPEVPREALFERVLTEAPSCEEKLVFLEALRAQPGPEITGLLQRIKEGFGEEECLAAPLEEALKERALAEE